MSTPKGYSSQEKEDRLSAQFSTVEPIKEHQFGLSVANYSTVQEWATGTVDAGSTSSVLVITDCTPAKGDIIYFTGGSLYGTEVRVWKVDGTSFSLAETLSVAPSAGDSIQVLRYKSPVVNGAGELIVALSELAIEEAGSPLADSKVKMMGAVDSSGDARQVLSDTDGHLQIDVLSSALPSGAATETTLATLATEATVSTLATEATVATLATEATVSTLATEATVATLATEATISTLATEATVATLATEATVATLATAAAQTDGTQKSQIVDGAGNVISSTSNALDVNLKSPVIVDVNLDEADDSVAVFGYDGTANRAIKTDVSGELQVDILSSALPAGAATETTLNAIKTAVETIDNAISGNEMQVDIKTIEGVIDANNTTSTPLLAGGNFTGAWTEIKDYNSINLGVFSDVASATDGLRIEYSFDGVSVHHFHLWTFPGGANGIGYQLSAEFRYFRINYTNGASPQATFLLQSNLKPTALFPSSYRASQTFTSQSQVILTKGIIVGETTGGGGGYVSVKVNPSGALTVEADVTSSVLPTGAATETTLAAIKTAVELLDNAVSGNELQVDVVTSALPTGAATETTLASIEGDTSSLAGCVSGSEVQVDVVGALPSGTNTIGKVDVNTLSVIDLLDAGILDTSSVNIAGSASSPTQVVASTAAATKKMQILDTTEAFIGLYTGPLASEVLQLVIGPGSDQTIEHAIPASTRISLKRLDSTTAISSGIVAINFIG